MDAMAASDLLITAELAHRPARSPNYAAENRALVQLAECLAQQPAHLLPQLTELALALCQAGSAGISLLRQTAEGEFFEWVALAGVFAPYVGGHTPREFSPCGTTLALNAPQLFYCPARLFTYFNEVPTPIVEGLVVPFAVNGCAAGTIWIVGHDAQQQFDAEDVRLMTSLARFTSAAWQVISALDATQTANRRLAREIEERRQMEQRLATIYQLSEAVNRAEALEQIYEAALTALARLLQVDRASILLCDATSVMRFQAWHNLSPAYRQAVEGHSPWAATETQPQPVLLPDVLEADLGPLQPIILAEGIRALAFIPLVEQARLLGKFMLYYDQPHTFTEDEVQLALTLARHVAHALQRKQAEAQLHQFNATLEQRVAERTQALERRNQELDQFAYVTSHDLKAPLRAIEHLAHWISQDAGHRLPPKSSEHLAKLRGRITRMERLLDDLLAYSRADRYQYSRESVDVAQLVEEIVCLVMPPQGFAVRVQLTLPMLCTQKVPLATVLRNLINNAIKHHDRSNGQVQIGVQDVGEFLEFKVSDDGPGIAPEFHERIFQVFQTLKPRDTLEGSGMGLAIAKKLVESRGGSIRVTSSEGQGTTFRFTWPKGERPRA